MSKLTNKDDYEAVLPILPFNGHEAVKLILSEKDVSGKERVGGAPPAFQCEECGDSRSALHFLKYQAPARPEPEKDEDMARLYPGKVCHSCKPMEPFDFPYVEVKPDRYMLKLRLHLEHADGSKFTWWDEDPATADLPVEYRKGAPRVWVKRGLRMMHALKPVDKTPLGCMPEVKTQPRSKRTGRSSE